MKKAYIILSTAVVSLLLISCSGFDTGNRKLSRNENPTSSDPIKANKVSASYVHSCFIENESLKCWGRVNYCGSLGCQSNNSAEQSRILTLENNSVTSIVTSAYGACLIKTNGSLFCWGDNSSGELARNDGFSGYSAYAREIFSSGITDVQFRLRHVCALQSDRLYCWGKNEFGEVGNSSNASSVNSPAIIMNTGVTQVTVGNYHTCAIRSGTVYCWGANFDAQMGNGLSGDLVYRSPQEILSLNVTSISAGYSHTCAIQNGDLYCWGSNWHGAIGNGIIFNPAEALVKSPFKTMSGGVTRVWAFQSATCAKQNNKVYCWGTSEKIFPALGLNANISTPMEVPALNDANDISMGYAHLCKSKDDIIQCYGENIFNKRRK